MKQFSINHFTKCFIITLSHLIKVGELMVEEVPSLHTIFADDGNSHAPPAAPVPREGQSHRIFDELDALFLLHVGLESGVHVAPNVSAAGPAQSNGLARNHPSEGDGEHLPMRVRLVGGGGMKNAVASEKMNARLMKTLKLREK